MAELRLLNDIMDLIKFPTSLQIPMQYTEIFKVVKNENFQ